MDFYTFILALTVSTVFDHLMLEHGDNLLSKYMSSDMAPHVHGKTTEMNI